MSLYEKLVNGEENLALVGLGYVGMPIAVAFAQKGLNVIGFDLNKEKIELVPQILECVRHVHLSEPYLKSLCKTSSDGEKLYRVIADTWKDPICIEMLSTSKERELAEVEKAIRYVQKFMGE